MPQDSVREFSEKSALVDASMSGHWAVRREGNMTSPTNPTRSAPVGYGFHPTDEELVNHFLKLKMQGGYDHEVGIIAEVNVCNFEPWELPGLSAIQSNDPECYFFSPRIYKYSNSQRREFVLCKLKKDPDDMPTFEEGEPSSNVASNSPNNVIQEDQLESFLGVDEGDYN
ncbi:unnamed protein product [Dovyalis caffra]|uniref:NAC domain-containing protein n=1 Tax=Dovyalis caffra TaxID=77055 RepID=A0AAV1S9B4_9ROSI|nr:unnamed protein product [Dovyalis caffra]